LKLKLLSFIFATCLCFGICAQASYATVAIPKGIGVCVHSPSSQDLDMIKAAGITITRLDLKWAGVEAVKGQYNWTATDKLVTDLTSRGIRPYFILDYNNTNYFASGEMVGICIPEQVKGFTAFAAAAVARYKGKGIIWEIWNEPNLDNYWVPANNVDQYMTLVKSAVPAIKSVDPGAIVVAPAVAFTANVFSFLDGCAKQGLYGLVDAVSIHPYQNANPENGGLDYLYDTIRNQIKTYNPGNPNLPIIGGEFGFSTTWSNVQNETTQAQFLTRQLLYHDYKYIPVSMIYNFKNDGTDPANAEHNFGLIRNDSTLKPAYSAVQAYTKNLAGMTFGGKMPTAASDYIYEYVNASGAKTAVAWTTGAAHSATVYGQSVNLTTTPVYVKNGVATPPPVVITPAPTVIIPAAPSTLKVTSVTKGATTGNYFVNLTWVDNSNNETQFELQQSVNSTNAFRAVAIPAQNSVGLSFNIGTAPIQGTYYYKILAVNTAGKSAPSNVANTTVATTTSTVTTTTTTPSNLTTQIGVIASTGTYHTILKWKDNATAEIGYDIYQSALDSNNFKLISSIGAFTGTGNISNTYTIGANPTFGTYYYKVVAKYADNKTETSNIASAAVKEYISAIPSTFAVIGSTDITNKPVTILSWRDLSVNEQGFNIYYSVSESGPFTKIGTAKKNSIKIIHPLDNVGTSYYKITSFNSAGESKESAIVPVIVN